MQDVLRKKIGYKGLIISDDLEMGGVLSTGEIEDVAVETLRAGADMFLVCHNQELVWRGFEAVLRTAERDRKFAAHVAKAAQRVLAFKKRSAELRGFAAEPTAKVVDKLKKIVADFSRIVGGEVIDDRLHTAQGDQRLIVAGVMSGTSADGVDVAVVSIQGRGSYLSFDLLAA